MKQYLIYASSKSGKYLSDTILAHNLRMAWYFFKCRHEIYFEGLRFVRASCRGRSYDKVN